MRIGLSLNLKNHCVDGKYYIQIFEKYIRFEPDKISYKKNGKSWNVKDWNEKLHKKLISECNQSDNIIVSSNENIFSASQTATDNPHRSIMIIQERTDFNISNEDIESSLKNNCFVSAYLYDEEYEYVQSTIYSNNLKGRGLQLESIRHTPFIIDKNSGLKEYDITFNPGRKELIGHTWLIPAWKMWFGDGFYHIVPKEHLLSFPDAFEIKELENGQLFIQLFEKLEESSSMENQEKQWKWRRWLNFEELVKLYP